MTKDLYDAFDEVSREIIDSDIVPKESKMSALTGLIESEATNPYPYDGSLIALMNLIRKYGTNVEVSIRVQEIGYEKVLKI